MRLILEVAMSPLSDNDRGAVLFQRQVDRPYSRVPVAGEFIFLGDDELERAVEQVTWDNDGTAHLMLQMFAEDRDGVSRLDLEALGFKRRPD